MNRRVAAALGTVALLGGAGLVACGGGGDTKPPAGYGVEGVAPEQAADPNAAHYDKLCALVDGKTEVTPALDKAMHKLYTTLPDPQGEISGPFVEVRNIHARAVEEARDPQFDHTETKNAWLQLINQYCADRYPG